MASWQALDSQMRQYRNRLLSEVRLSQESHLKKLASNLSWEVRCLDATDKRRIAEASPVLLESRRKEFEAFQHFCDQMNGWDIPNPAFVRARVIYQNYLCFVYAPESLFRVLNETAEDGSATKRCSKYLLRGRLHYFRNAIAHSNWQYKSDFSGIEYWSRKSNEPDAAMHEFEVEQDELDFWQALSRCVAYTTLLNV